MIKYIEGDIFKSPAQVIVNTVNTVGVMGKGVALAFKERYPNMFEQYKKVCEKHLLTIGKLMLVYEADYWLLLFPTKESWRSPSKIEYIEKGLIKFVQTYADKGITSVAFPKLGCGNGGLDWSEVKPVMERYLEKLPIDVYVYIGKNPDSLPEHQMQAETEAWLKENAKDMSFNGIKEEMVLSSAILPYSFKIGGAEYEMKWDNGVKIARKELKGNCEMSEDDMFVFWDRIRNDMIFQARQLSEAERLVSGLLCAKGYLSEIKVFDSKVQKMEAGYQLNGGLQRSSTLEVA